MNAWVHISAFSVLGNLAQSKDNSNSLAWEISKIFKIPVSIWLPQGHITCVGETGQDEICPTSKGVPSKNSPRLLWSNIWLLSQPEVIHFFLKIIGMKKNKTDRWRRPAQDLHQCLDPKTREEEKKQERERETSFPSYPHLKCSLNPHELHKLYAVFSGRSLTIVPLHRRDGRRGWPDLGLLLKLLLRFEFFIHTHYALPHFHQSPLSLHVVWPCSSHQKDGFFLTWICESSSCCSSGSNLGPPYGHWHVMCGVLRHPITTRHKPCIGTWNALQEWGTISSPVAVLYNLILLSKSDVCSVDVDDSMRLAPDEPQPLKGDLSGLELAFWQASYQAACSSAWLMLRWFRNPPALFSPVFNYTALTCSHPPLMNVWFVTLTSCQWSYNKFAANGFGDLIARWRALEVALYV